MADLPNEIFRRWHHSFEEDASGVTVYRPTEYGFPRARGRAGIEFTRDGKFTEWAIGPGDAQRGIAGRWTAESPNRARVSFEKAPRAPRVIEIVQCDFDVLRVKQSAA